MKHKDMFIVLSILGFLLIVSSFFSLWVGNVTLDVTGVLEALSGGGDTMVRTIIMDVRLPRVALAVLVGGTLGASGALLQCVFRNPLAEPGIVGVSSSAALGAVLVLYLGVVNFTSVVVPLSAMTMAIAVMGFLLTLVLVNASMLTLTLAGVIVNSFTAALTALALNLSPNPFAYNDILFWLMGSLTNRSIDDVMLILPFLALGFLLMLLSLPALGVTVLTSEVARSLGINLRWTRALAIAGVSLSVGATVAVSGVIGFVGLIAPHMVRPFVGHRPSHVFYSAALMGALILLGADTLIRLLPFGANLRLGVVTALMGAPFFMYYLLAQRRHLP